MKKDANDEQVMVRMELKYCEHCGGLWVREGGAGVYCERCRRKIEDLPAVKKKPGRINLPVRRRTVLEGYSPERVQEFVAIEATGGMA